MAASGLLPAAGAPPREVRFSPTEPDKLRELAALFRPARGFIGPGEFAGAVRPAEDGSTLARRLIKARAALKLTGLRRSDDTGLELDALGGERACLGALRPARRQVTPTCGSAAGDGGSRARAPRAAASARCARVLRSARPSCRGVLEAASPRRPWGEGFATTRFSRCGKRRRSRSCPSRRRTPLSHRARDPETWVSKLRRRSRRAVDRDRKSPSLDVRPRKPLDDLARLSALEVMLFWIRARTSRWPAWLAGREAGKRKSTSAGSSRGGYPSMKAFLVRGSAPHRERSLQGLTRRAWLQVSRHPRRALRRRLHLRGVLTLAPHLTPATADEWCGCADKTCFDWSHAPSASRPG